MGSANLKKDEDHDIRYLLPPHRDLEALFRADHMVDVLCRSIDVDSGPSSPFR